MTSPGEKEETKKEEPGGGGERAGRQLVAQLARCYLAGWGLPALAASITAAATLSQTSQLGSPVFFIHLTFQIKVSFYRLYTFFLIFFSFKNIYWTIYLKNSNSVKISL